MAAIQPGGDGLTIQLRAGHQRRGHFQAGHDRIDRIEDRFLVLLQVTVVGQRQAF